MLLVIFKKNGLSFSNLIWFQVSAGFAGLVQTPILVMYSKCGSSSQWVHPIFDQQLVAAGYCLNCTGMPPVFNQVEPDRQTVKIKILDIVVIFW